MLSMVGQCSVWWGNAQYGGSIIVSEQTMEIFPMWTYCFFHAVVL